MTEIEYISVQVPKTTKTTCDFCNKQNESSLWNHHGVPTEITIRHDTHTPPVRRFSTWNICPECWDSKVRPALMNLALRDMQTHAIGEGNV